MKEEVKLKNEPNQINFNQKKRVDIDENSLRAGEEAMSQTKK